MSLHIKPLTLMAMCCALAVQAAPPPNAAIAPDGSVGEVHDAQYLDLSLPLDHWQVGASKPAEQELTWPMFIQEVLASNLDYAAARYNVDMAVADASAAKLLPNPVLALGANRDLAFHDKTGIGNNGQPARLRQVENSNIGITQTIEWPGKRYWRIMTADQTLRSAAATLDDFLRNLKLDAATAFANALATQRAVDQLTAAAGFLDTLNQTQQTSFKAGAIGRPDLLQTQVEQQEFLNDLSRAQDVAESARYALSTFLGRDRGRTDFHVSGELRQIPRDIDLDSVLKTALEKRADLVSLRHARDAAESTVKLAKASVYPDVDVGLNYGYNSKVVSNHPVDPTPNFHQLTLNFGLPLPLFDHGQYAIPKARAAADQAQVQLTSAELHAEVDIRTAYAQVQSAQRRVASFDGDILKKADELLDARRYGYQRGANSLLDLIDAQRSDNQLHQDADLAQVEFANALIQLERVSGAQQALHF